MSSFGTVASSLVVCQSADGAAHGRQPPRRAELLGLADDKGRELADEQLTGLKAVL
jgi:hypothetical protein